MSNLKPKSFEDTERFLMVLLAARRAWEIENGSVLMVPRNGNMNAVVSLREMKAGVLDFGLLYDALKASFRPVGFGEKVREEEPLSVTQDKGPKDLTVVALEDVESSEQS